MLLDTLKPGDTRNNKHLFYPINPLKDADTLRITMSERVILSFSIPIKSPSTGYPVLFLLNFVTLFTKESVNSFLLLDLRQVFQTKNSNKS